MSNKEKVFDFCMFVSTETGALISGSVPRGVIHEVLTIPILGLDTILILGLCTEVPGAFSTVQPRFTTTLRVDVGSQTTTKE